MKKILFVCRGNVGRSQMAEALMKKYSRVEAASAGTKVPQEGPGKEGKQLKDIPVAEHVIRCLREEENIDVSEYRNKSLHPDMVEDADRIIVMAEQETVPAYLINNDKTEFWHIGDPLGKSYSDYRLTKEQIKKLVLQFIARHRLGRQ